MGFYMGYTYNKNYLIKDENPWFPVMGEIHYSRFREEFWEEALRKMKAGGITVAATYVFWIHHEEEEGAFVFEGCRDLKKFVELCRKIQMKLFLRIGPWCHGEVRNGGFPDWLLQKGFTLRCDDERYLAYVERFWKQIYEQVRGEMYEDGGPIIGIQIENEYGHVGGFSGEAGEQHMRTLKGLAEKTGFQVPLYTATGWGGAVTGGMLPVMAGYCEAPWDPRLTEIEANENYVFSGKRNDALVANDHHVSSELTFSQEDFPYLTAELGGGLQPTEHRRPVPTGTDIGAMSLAKLGSGVAMLGYYMYHGGSNPKGKFSTLQESRESGYPNDVPVINYDFFAPIRQYGQISETYKEIKLLAMFLADFGDDMAKLPEEIAPADISPEDTHSLRTSWRHDDIHGYVFFNNYQRKRAMDAHMGVKLTGRCRDAVEFHEIDIPSGAYGFFPYHMKLGDKELVSAAATPLCRLEGSETCYVFYGDYEPFYCWKEEGAALTLHLSRADALNAWKITLDRDYLILSDNYVWEEDGEVKVTGAPYTKIKCYPDMPAGIPGFARCGRDGAFTVYERKEESSKTAAKFRMIHENEETRTYEIEIQYSENILDCILTFAYGGDKLEIYQGDELLNDYYYTGEPAELSLRYFDFPEKLLVKIYALHEGHKRFLEKWPEMQNGKACELITVSARDEIR